MRRCPSLPKTLAASDLCCSSVAPQPTSQTKHAFRQPRSRESTTAPSDQHMARMPRSPFGTQQAIGYRSGVECRGAVSPVEAVREARGERREARGERREVAPGANGGTETPERWKPRLGDAAGL
jgi:hypothetical protein